MRALADRHSGIGCDQLIVMEPPGTGADVFMRIWNPDGSEAGACGNATRCVARFLMDQGGKSALRLATDHAVLSAEDAGRGLTRVNMGAPVLDFSATRPMDGERPVATRWLLEGTCVGE